MSQEVCAAIVTFYPDGQLEKSIQLLRPQVQELVIIDNHSSDDELQSLRRMASLYRFTLIENSKNLGIGAALNQAVLWAQAQSGIKWIGFFDQDSTVSETFVSEMLDALRSEENREDVYLICPKVIDRRSGFAYSTWNHRGRYLVAQTSGSMMRLEVFRSEGMFREDLFIEFVDFEFCLRVAQRKWRILYCPPAELLHEPGRMKIHQLPFRIKVRTSHASPVRRYYSLRNGLWTLTTYGTSFPRWTCHKIVQIIKGLIVVLIFEAERGEKLRMWGRAVCDVLRNRLGEFSDKSTT